MLNKIFVMLIFLLVLFIYTKMKNNDKIDRENKDYNIVKKYLLKDLDNKNNLNNLNSKLPILWILVEHRPNARNWLSFGSRLTNNLNQPYLNTSIKSIVNKCNKSFNVCIIDDNSIESILPEWNIDMKLLSEPIKCKMRELAKANILKKYGGMFVPPSFICFKDLIEIYNDMTSNNKMFVGEFLNKTLSSEYKEYLPSSIIIGSPKNNEILNTYINYLENMISNDYTAESVFLGNINNWLNVNVEKNNINLLESEYIGVKDLNDNPVTIEKLFSNNYIEFNPKFYGVYVPNNEIIKRNNYNWFSKLSNEQSVNVESLLGTLLKISCST
jgi:hypothetical protein